MCDYSLHLVASRPANVGERFPHGVDFMNSECKYKMAANMWRTVMNLSAGNTRLRR